MLRIYLAGYKAEVRKEVVEDSRREGEYFFSKLYINYRGVLSICYASVICDSTLAKRYFCSATGLVLSRDSSRALFWLDYIASKVRYDWNTAQLSVRIDEAHWAHSAVQLPLAES
jgi:hypothetical protein